VTTNHWGVLVGGLGLFITILAGYVGLSLRSVVIEMRLNKEALKVEVAFIKEGIALLRADVAGVRLDAKAIEVEYAKLATRVAILESLPTRCPPGNPDA
jgi:hypothetical protein